MTTYHSKPALLLAVFLCASNAFPAPPAAQDTNAAPVWLARPLSLKDTIDLALQQKDRKSVV